MNDFSPAALAHLMGLMCEAIALRGEGRTAQALDALDQALALDPRFLPACMQRAELLCEAGEYAVAVAAYEACLDIVPDFDDARVAYRRSLVGLVARCEAAPASDAVAGFTHATALFKLDRVADALVQVERVLAADAGHFPSLALRADLLLRQNRHDEALASYDGVEEDALATFNRADILRQMGRTDEALAGYTEALQRHPGLAQAQVGRAHMLLMRGDFAEGWRAHEARKQIPELAGRSVRSDRPAWQPGQDIRGKHLLLWAEQGLGDALQFARYIGPAADRAGRTTVCVPPGLLPLLAPSFPECDFTVNDKAPPSHDVHASLLSLPLLLDLPDPTRAPTVPYLKPDADAVVRWKQLLDDTCGNSPRRPRIGIAWAGRQYATIHHSRDIPLAQLAPLFELPVDFISLQPQIPAGDLVAREVLGERLRDVPLADWADTAALVEALDLIVSVDTAVAHLAGALGRQALLMLRFEGEWRWGPAAARTTWYPATLLARQQRRGEWGEVIEQAASVCRQL